jgi:hypothetical protein
MSTRHFATIKLNALDFPLRTIPAPEHVLLQASLTIMHHNADHVASLINLIAKITVLAFFSMGLSLPIQQGITVSHVLVDMIQPVLIAARLNA